MRHAPHSQLTIAIIPAAGMPTNRILQNSTLSDTMLPINGKPVIGYILEDLLARKVYGAIIILRKGDTHTEAYVVQTFSERMQLQFVYSPYGRGVGYSIYLATKHIHNHDSVLVYLGDTIYKGKLSFEKDFLVVHGKYEEPQKWCFVEESPHGRVFVNKPREYSGTGKILCGLYHFIDAGKFLKAVEYAVNTNSVAEMYHILEYYQKRHPFKLINARQWYDCGNIENYYAAKMDFLKVRSFNSISYDPLLGILTKSGKNRAKIEQEIFWFQNVPPLLQSFVPRLFDHHIDSGGSRYSIEYYGYQSLADMFLFSLKNVKIWESVIHRLFDITSLFKRYSGLVPYRDFADTYIAKTQQRLSDMEKTPYWKKLLHLNVVMVNGNRLKNVFELMPGVKAFVPKLYRKRDVSFIHGDLCLGNILYDVDNRLVKLIDPRGYFGKRSIYGDIKYDLAKLRHSFHGMYDFIVADLFRLVEDTPGSFSYKVFSEPEHEQIGKVYDTHLVRNGYSLKEIQFLEGLLFLSMIPLHADNFKRQQAMFVTGLKLLNEIL